MTKEDEADREEEINNTRIKYRIRNEKGGNCTNEKVCYDKICQE